MKKWTKDELAYIKNNYPNMTRQQFADFFKVPLTTIKALTRRYRFEKGKGSQGEQLYQEQLWKCV